MVVGNLRHLFSVVLKSLIMSANVLTVLNPVMLLYTVEDCCGEEDKCLFNNSPLISQQCIYVFIFLFKKCTINMISGNLLRLVSIFGSFCVIFSMSKAFQIQ